MANPQETCLSLPPNAPGDDKSTKPAPVTLYNYSATAQAPQQAAREASSKGKIAYISTIASDLTVVMLLSDELKKRGIDPHADAHAHMVLLSEWDSDYGRDLPQSIENAFQRSGDCTDQLRGAAPPPDARLHCFSYMRGVDGALAEAPASASETKNTGNNKGSHESDQANTPLQPLAEQPQPRIDLSKNIEHPNGNGQYDYLRRMVARIQELERRLHEKGDRLVAVGVVGSDVYDKLAALQLLRPAFPEAVFFTTDLDARLYHPTELGWTRNLIVASAYGLELRDELQGGIPPFRAAYQTSAFLAARLALEDSGRETPPPSGDLQWTQHPGVYQIGIGRPFAFALSPETKPLEQKTDLIASLQSGLEKIFSSNPPAASAAEQQPSKDGKTQASSPTDDLCADLRSCTAIMAPSPFRADHPWDLVLWRAFLGWSAATGLVLLGVSLLVSRRLRAWLTGYPSRADTKSVTSPSDSVASFIIGLSESEGSQTAPVVASDSVVHDRRRKPNKKARSGYHPLTVLAIFFVLGVVLCLSWPWMAGVLSAHGAGEPLVFQAGISLWPTIAMRIVITVLAAILTFCGLRQLDENMQAIAQDFGLDLPPQREGFFQRLKESLKLLRKHVPDLIYAETWREMYNYRLLLDDSVEDPLAMFWRRYCTKGRKPFRLFRVCIATTAVMLAYLVLDQIFGNPEPSARSALLRNIDWWLAWLQSIATWFLILFIADATFFCYSFVRDLQHFRSRWTEQTIRKYEKELGINGRYLDHWIDMQFVAKRTSCINRLAVYPFLVLALTIVSRTTVFGAFPTNWPTYIMAAIGLLLVFLCVWLLGRAADHEREAALRQVATDLTQIRAHGPISERPLASVHQLKFLRTRIEEMQSGAFKPVWQQPVVAAWLAPGSTVLLNFLPLMGIN
ncbi:MAG TPA: hypothetical protein VNH44_14750 [Micropepsaceae bacterium]|nr:hypothetical protein [Micropepsaceae bacterium]